MGTEVIISSEMKARIIDKVVRVLHQNHSHPEKRRILESKERFRCGIIGYVLTTDRSSSGDILS